MGNQATESVLREVKRERQYQDAKWGEQNHDLTVWTAILGEEVGEFCKEAIEGWAAGARHRDEARAEAIQVAAVAVAIVECIDRRKS